MGAVRVADTVSLENEDSIRKHLVGEDGRMASGILLDLPESLGLSPSVLSLNDEKAVKRSRDSTVRHAVLKLHGISVGETLTPVKEYVLAVFQTKVVAVWRTRGHPVWNASARKKQTYVRADVTESSKEMRKAQALAIRAVYALGLDYGLVRLRIGTGRRMGIVNVQPAPILNKDMEKGFVQAIQSYYQQCIQPKPSVDRIVLGADPEFVMKTPDGNLVIASRYVPIRGKVGCDAIWIGQNRNQKPLFELRPEPTPDPKTLVVRMYQALLYCAKKTRHVQCKWLAGSLPHPGFPIGGHIHFSGILPDFKLLRALDNYLTLPLTLAEDAKGIKRRPKYGFLGDFRYQEHGGFEYRTPPSWLVSPTLTKGVLAAAKVIAVNYRSLRHDPFAQLKMQEAYYSGNKKELAAWLEPIWEDLRQTEEYRLYARYLDDFFRYLASGKVWDETRDFRKSWRIPPYHLKNRGR
ncbi:putative amidoligase domain-containing protein [Staphylospora marina]|uniref:putative amidoligase domain-containing protein n=1 Tax=Staphylospora marina TaxID=2490858 RepID=UPI0013DE049D|nr:hypothetical protein [Staphylospora marina]